MLDADALRPAGYVFGVTQTETGTTTLPGAGLPISIRSAFTSSPLASVKLAQGFGMRPKMNFWIGSPVVEFMIVAVIGMDERRVPSERERQLIRVGWLGKRLIHLLEDDACQLFGCRIADTGVGHRDAHPSPSWSSENDRGDCRFCESHHAGMRT